MLSIRYEDAVHLLYPEDFNVLSTMTHLAARKILCLSDTTDVYLADTEATNSIAVNLTRQLSEGKAENEESFIELMQADYLEFEYNAKGKLFGAHLPQNINQPRREYTQIDNSEFKISQLPDLILGKALLCCCYSSVSCGGIKANHKDQERFLQSLIATGSNLIILSSNAIPNFVDPLFHMRGKKELLVACKNVALLAPDYEIIFGDNIMTELFNYNFKINGHILILAKKEALVISDLSQNAFRFSAENIAPSGMPQHIIATINAQADIDTFLTAGQQVTNTKRISSQFDMMTALSPSLCTSSNNPLTPAVANGNFIPEIQPVASSNKSTTLTASSRATTSAALFKPAENKSSHEEIFLQGCSDDMKAYIRILKARKLHSEIVKELSLTPDEITQLSCYYDQNTKKVLDRPVMVNEKGPYELSCVIQERDPRNSFQPINVDACWSLINTFEDEIRKITQSRETTMRMTMR